MKTIYLLFVVLTGAPEGCDRASLECTSQGYETMLPVTNLKHHSMLECKVEKAQHKDIIDNVNGVNKVQFFCGDETMYFNKQQRLY